ncbi:small subunit ribosomal protein S6e [Nematocida sp. AWRm77]|nr:small subunit ribosomal protein S6e [Nematocida sp. AWRm77]
MKLNISHPINNTQVFMELEQNVESALYEKQIGDTVDGKFIGSEWEGHILQITGGSDKQGFPMKPGVRKQERVRLLLKKGDIGFHSTRDGLRRRKSVRGCIISSEVRALNLQVLQDGPTPIPGFTDTVKGGLKGPKRASKIRKLFGLDPSVINLEDYVIAHKKTTKSGEEKIVKPKIQRLITEKKKERELRRSAERRARQEKNQQKKKAYRAMMNERRATLLAQQSSK